jgi:hypothetical protein
LFRLAETSWFKRVSNCQLIIDESGPHGGHKAAHLSVASRIPSSLPVQA